MSTGSVQPFNAAGTVTIAASTTSAAAALGTGDAVLIYNASSALAFVAFGGAGIGSPPVAGAGGFPVPPGGSRLVACPSTVNTVAAAVLSGSGNVYVSYGTGTIY